MGFSTYRYAHMCSMRMVLDYFLLGMCKFWEEAISYWYIIAWLYLMTSFTSFGAKFVSSSSYCELFAVKRLQASRIAV